MATVLVIGSLLGGTGVAHAGATEIPKGFLLTEPAATAGPIMEDEEWWKISNSLSRQLELNPCRTKGKPRDGRVAMRTITYSNSAPSGSSEQLVLYRSTRPAQAAFRKLRTDLARCPRRETAKGDTGSRFGYVGKPLRVGDEALSVAGYFHKQGKREREPVEMGVVARRGAALFIYTDIGNGLGAGKKIVNQAKKMTKKVCDLPGVCG
ncbi:hypothetical protein OG884_01850 [Streptosporangium sp. NBC_01755]|uniref:hypothetical protein n=1 Tax=unclassified Streptosporangium TaxID=2632669 RepID=UPI002DDA779D|nr:MULTISPECIES: hypothetical protein [unclassified Streptosporangium]WSA27817.1 hypothetical protein OIE13_08100 [Streptosporangium sp. NBC_01810]WSD00708.1 hypothetical protein OG884_01850 [Streptosporangium sp. NBC_01755]